MRLCSLLCVGDVISSRTFIQGNFKSKGRCSWLNKVLKDRGQEKRLDLVFKRGRSVQTLFLLCAQEMYTLIVGLMPTTC